jgi:hypothetical protein
MSQDMAAAMKPQIIAIFRKILVKILPFSLTAVNESWPYFFMHQFSTQWPNELFGGFAGF